jgi:hypothetical protein
MSQHTSRAANASAGIGDRGRAWPSAGAPPPQETDARGARTWITRGANFVVTVSDVVAGSALARADNPDEYMVLLTPGSAATVEAGKERIASPGDALFIVPPGASRVTATAAGRIARIFSNRAADLCAQAGNASVYADGAPEVAPLEPWPAPEGGFRLRHYPLERYLDPAIFGRLFRSTNLMVNVFAPTTTARDTKKLSPHSHADFEQGSLSLSGTVVHHLRTPWTPDMTAWREDEHAEFASPALLVIPANLIHTTAYTGGGGPNWFIDIFSPPRRDFSEKPGWVRNADEYPMPG